MGDVAELHPEQAVDITPGAEVRYGHHFDDRRSVSFQVNLPAGIPVDKQQRALSNIISVGVISHLKELVIEYRKEIARSKRLLVMNESPDHENRKKMAEIQVEIDTLNMQTIERLNAMEVAYQVSGRQGEFRPMGREKAEIDGIRKDVDTRTQKRQELETELKNKHDGLVEAIKGYEWSLVEAEVEIELRRAAYGE
jgi:hypothetical protein